MQEIDQIKKYSGYSYGNDYFHLDKVPAEIAVKLLTGWPNVNPEDCQNRSPSMKVLVETALKYKGTLNGYCIPIESGRSDARISFDAIELKLKKSEALKLCEELKPDSFSPLGKGLYRYWWD